VVVPLAGWKQKFNGGYNDELKRIAVKRRRGGNFGEHHAILELKTISTHQCYGNNVVPPPNPLLLFTDKTFLNCSNFSLGIMRP
jgi:hypothetical protein